LSTHNRYIISLMIAACTINIILAFAGQKDITLFFTLNVIAFLAITVLHVYLNPRARAALNTIGVVFFGAFMVIVAIKVAEILAGT
jgi:hypothetical protein